MSSVEGIDEIAPVGGTISFRGDRLGIDDSFNDGSLFIEWQDAQFEVVRSGTFASSEPPNGTVSALLRLLQPGAAIDVQLRQGTLVLSRDDIQITAERDG